VPGEKGLDFFVRGKLATVGLLYAFVEDFAVEPVSLQVQLLSFVDQFFRIAVRGMRQDLQLGLQLWFDLQGGVHCSLLGDSMD
jgi:hypothetical protein